jgi:hypothetical protein
MKTIFLASALALATLTTGVAQANAATVVVRTDTGHHRHMHRAMPKHCVTKKTVRWHHGKKVVTVKRVCR